MPGRKILSFGGSGGGSGGGRVPPSFLREISLSERDRLVQDNDYMPRVQSDKMMFATVKSRTELVALAVEHLQKDFKAFRVDILQPQELSIPGFPMLSPLIAASYSDNRLVYVPDKKRLVVYVTGQEVGTSDIYLTLISAVKVSRSEIMGIPYRSFVVAPLVCRQNGPHKLDEGQYVSHGAIVLWASVAEMLDGLAGLVPLKRYAESLAAEMSRLS